MDEGDQRGPETLFEKVQCLAFCLRGKLWPRKEWRGRRGSPHGRSKIQKVIGSSRDFFETRFRRSKITNGVVRGNARKRRERERGVSETRREHQRTQQLFLQPARGISSWLRPSHLYECLLLRPSFLGIQSLKVIFHPNRPLAVANFLLGRIRPRCHRQKIGIAGSIGKLSST